MRVQTLGFAIVFLASGCASKAPEPRAATPRVVSPSSVSAIGATDTTAHAEATPVGANEPATTAAADAAQPDVIDPLAAELCGAYCERLAAECTGSVAEECQFNCTRFQEPGSLCTGIAHTALACAKGARDLTCTSIAPASCTNEFQRLAACVEGRELPARSEEPQLPRDWQRVEVDQLAIVMPIGIEKRGEESTLELVASEGPIEYSVRALPAPAAPPNQNNATLLTLRALGSCTKNLRVSGVIERPGYFSSRFSSTCLDGARREGRLVYTGGSLYMLSASSKSGDPGPNLDVFLYSFERK